MQLNDLNKDLVYYLASPYSTPIPPGFDSNLIKTSRYNSIVQIAAQLFNEQFILIEPIASSHPMSEKYQLGQTFDIWARRDKALIQVSNGGLLVVCLIGWEYSIGVQEEMKFAQSLNKPIYLLEVDLKQQKVLPDIKKYETYGNL